ncbi:MAG: polysaccharide deacetylase family protein [Clostridiales bacterium]|nr:polysaccharide deacetylase family protein [Clostridiales bacterium]
MSRKIRLFSCLIIIAIGAASAIVVVEGKSIDDVEKVQMQSNTSDSVSIEWKKVNKAEGYHIYLYNDESETYENFTNIDGGKTNNCELKELDSARKYKLQVKAFKHFNNVEYESEDAQSLDVYTLPSKQKITATSDKVGVLSLKWNEAKTADGYEIQYSLDETFDETNTENKDNPEDVELNVEDLTPNDTYYARARTFLIIDGDNIYGEWSDTVNVKIKQKVVMSEDLDTDKPMVALTFDDGPSYAQDDGKNSTEKILDVLEEYGARATFFMCGSRVNEYNSYLLEKEIEIGCELGNHTYDHTHYGDKVTAEDIKKSSDAIEKACGQAPTIFRCPGGIITSKTRKECVKEGMPIAYWSVDTEDWKSRDADKIYKKVMNNVYDGCIILMHDIYDSTAEAVEKIVPALIEEGYQIVTVSELIKAKTGEEPKAGEQYVDYETINNDTN